MSRRRPDLEQVTSALDTLLDQGQGLLGDQHVNDLRELRQRIDERLGRGDALTVVAVAGGTGVGKSALVNRLARTSVATEGVRRPTTDHAIAVAATLDAEARTLLDHLDISDRRVVGDTLPDGLLLVDLPDHDSVVAANQRTAQRLTRRVDALVVVVDPIKYARADLHDGPLAELSRHAEVVTVALNRSDELADADLARTREDLAARLADDGLGEAVLLTTSAATGDGTDELRDHLERLVAARTAAVRRLTADAAQLADRIAAEAPPPPTPPERVDTLVEPLLVAVDADRATAEAATSYRHDAARGCRSPLARLVRFLPAGLAAQLRGTFSTAPTQGRPLGRSTAAIEATLARHLELAGTTGAAHATWARTIERISATAAPRLLDAIDTVPVAPRPRAWWRVLAGCRGLVEVVALAGLLWLLVIGLGDWLGLPDVPSPAATDALSWPAALFLGGLAARIALGVCSRVCAAVGARRHASRVERRVRHELTGAVEAQVLAPVHAEVERRRSVRAQLATLRGPPATGGSGRGR